jgi:hypothetical protein
MDLGTVCHRPGPNTDGIRIWPLDNFVQNATKDEVVRALSAAYLESEKVVLPYTPIGINTGRQLVAVDKGAGPDFFEQTKGALGQFQDPRRSRPGESSPRPRAWRGIFLGLSGRGPDSVDHTFGLVANVMCRCYGGSGEGMAPSALFNSYRRSSPMSQHCHFDASRSLTALEQDNTIIAVIEMSQSKWLVSALVPGVERQPLKKLDAHEEGLLKLLYRWRNEAGQAGREIKRIVVAYEAGRDGFWLARRLLRNTDINGGTREHCRCR